MEEKENEKSNSEKFLERVEKKYEKAEYDKVVETLKDEFKDEFDEKIISDFKDAEWFFSNESDESSKMIKLLNVPSFKIIDNGKKFEDFAECCFYRETLYGEHNNIDVLVLEKANNEIGYYDDNEEEGYEEAIYVLWVALNKKKSQINDK